MQVYHESAENLMISKLLSDPTNDEPFFSIDIQDVLRKIKLWRVKLPRVQPYYAIKCNPTPALLKIFAAFDMGFDCASKNEIETVLAHTGVESSRIIYANPCKTRSFIRHAKSRGVSRMTFDNLAELDKIAEVYPEAELVLRIKVDDSGSLMQFSTKFGADLKRVPVLLTHARDLGLNVIGVSFHVGSGCCNPKCFADAISNAKWTFEEAQKIGFKPFLLDIGGGFPGNTGTEFLFDSCSRAINEQLDESFPVNSGVKIIAEPGRFMAASAFTLYTTVIAKRHENDNRIMYYLNDGVYGSFNCKVFDHAEPIPIPIGNTSTRMFPSVLWGPTCDSLDKISDCVLLPELQIGNWIVFRDMGAYTCAAASEFNGFAKPKFKYAITPAAEVLLSHFPLGRELLKDVPYSSETDVVGFPQYKTSSPDAAFQFLAIDAY